MACILDNVIGTGESSEVVKRLRVQVRLEVSPMTCVDIELPTLVQNGLVIVLSELNCNPDKRITAWILEPWSDLTSSR